MSTRPETAILIVAHGSYGLSLLSTAEALVGPLDVEVVQICLGTGREAMRQRLLEMIRRRDRGGGVLLLVDLCGSTPANLCLSMVEQDDTLEMLTGLNLSMLVKLSTCDRRTAAQELARELQESARRSTVCGSSLLQDGGSCGY